MKKEVKILVIIIFACILTTSSISEAATNKDIVFKDKNLQSVLLKCYNWEGSITVEKAGELSKKEDIINIDNANISDLEGLQYFKYLKMINLSSNSLKNLSALSQLKKLEVIYITYNTIKGKQLEKILMDAGKISKLNTIGADEDGLTSVKFLGSIGNIKNYESIQMKNNKISDISILKDATNLKELDMRDNRITDVTPLKDIKTNSYVIIKLCDNCIIDYSPIKHLFDKMYEDFDMENGMDRYDFYTNPVNFSYNGKKIKFPYLTVYYKYQAYAEAVPLLKAFGGNAEYNKKKGTLTCNYDGNVLVFKDFSKKYTLNGKEKSLKYPMRRMQYDLAYVPVKDICQVLGLEYNVTQTKAFYLGNDEYENAPKLVEIRKAVKELG